MDILKRAREIQPEVVANRRYLHQHPELGFDLDNTVRFVKEKLTEMGYVPLDCGDHGVVATVGGKHGGKCILIRGDMDALPMAEESGLDFASLRGDAAHTCGHDTHTATLLGAAKILKEMEDELPGTVKLMFQPAEELCAGARSMLEDGVLENPKVDAAFGTHIMAMLESGKVAYAPGPMFASCDLFTITVKGHGGHGSQPQTSIDPIVVGAHLITALQTINAREVAPSDIAVLTIGCFQAGSACNIIPESAKLMGSIRSFDADVRAFVKQRLIEITEGTVKTFRATADIEFMNETGPVVTDKGVMQSLGDAVAAVLGEEHMIRDLAPFSGSEDFGYITAAVPAGFFAIGGSPKDYPALPQHNPRIRFDEDAFVNGVATYVAGAVGWLEANRE
ncbi:MAG: amidohydrolase [Oscillospiraceae bacterium]|nr:amidohydrolase [Oscillospiraceae bacterium]